MDQKIYSSNKQNHQSGKHNHYCSTGCFNCWSISGRLYPKNQLDDIKNIVTNLESSKTLYTKCDYYLERSVHEVILKLEDQFKEYNTLMENELQLQNKLLNDLWMNTQKYLILTRSNACVKIYPEIISAAVEERVLFNIAANIRKIHDSNCCMTKSLENIRSVMAELKQRCDHLDYSVESPFISGSYNINPLNYYMGLISDIFSYFHQYLCTLKYFAELLSPEDTVAIEDYMSAIKSDKNYENFKENLHSYECL